MAPQGLFEGGLQRLDDRLFEIGGKPRGATGRMATGEFEQLRAGGERLQILYQGDRRVGMPCMRDEATLAERGVLHHAGPQHARGADAGDGSRRQQLVERHGVGGLSGGSTSFQLCDASLSEFRDRIGRGHRVSPASHLRWRLRTLGGWEAVSRRT
jgi:hypothetical protein